MHRTLIALILVVAVAWAFAPDADLLARGGAGNPGGGNGGGGGAPGGGGARPPAGGGNTPPAIPGIGNPGGNAGNQPPPANAGGRDGLPRRSPRACHQTAPATRRAQCQATLRRRPTNT